VLAQKAVYELDSYRARNPGLTKSELIAQILRAFEEAGDATRYLNTKGHQGRNCLEGTPRMLTRLADAEREVEDDLADW
jgi:hypothetical protein